MSQQVKQAPNAPIDLRAYHPLARLRRVIRAYVLLEGVLLALILGCMWFWFSTALDFSLQYLFGIDLLDSARPVRWVLSVLFVAGMGAIVIWYIARRLFRDFSAASLALVLEKRFPELLGDRLITAVELYDLKRAEKQGYSVEMIVKTMKDAKERVDQIPIRSVFNWPRLALLAWVLLGVSMFLLLLTYPIAVLCTLFGQQRGPALWAMLTVNSLLVLSLAFVFAVPFLYARMRKASSKLRWALVGIAVVCATTTAVGYDYALKQVNSIKMHEYSWRLNHVADISLDRNMRFKETRWPKDEHFVEWLDFPVDSKRIQLNKTINARAYVVTWIIADDAAPKRWRPVKWSDLPKLFDARIPDLPIDKIHAYLVAIADGDERSPVGYDKTKLELPSKDDVNVDLVMAVVNDVDSPAAQFSAAERQPFEMLAVKLDALAADPKLGGRTIRKIGVPESMTLVYGSAESKQKGRSKLTVLDERRNVFSLEQPVQLGDNFAADGEAFDDTGVKIKERRVALVAEAEIDGKPAATPTKSVALVRPPKLDTLRYREENPAYLYYLPPSGPRANSIDERRRLMRDLRQTMPEMTTQLPPDSVTMNLFQGSELTYTAISDKKLQEVILTPRNPDFPGCASKNDMFPVHLNVAPDGRTFTVKFAANGRPLRDWHQINELAGAPSGTASSKQNPVFPLIAKSMTFDVAMKDLDNMTSTRTFTVRPIEDKLPNVNVYVDVIRQVQVNDRTVYMCTSKAEIPFTKESNVVDDNGLHKVEFSYEYMPLANSAVVSVRAELAAWLLASTPVLPNIGDYLYRREVLLRTISTGKNPGAIKGTVPIDSFANKQGLQDKSNILTIEQLKPKLEKLLPERYESPVLKKYEFTGSEPVVFDLQSRLPRLGEKDANGIVPIYDLVLNVRATDSNVLADFDRFSENRDAPFVFRIVSQEELYAHIAREESELVRRFDEMIGKLVANKQILEGSFARVTMGNLSPSTVASEQTRVEGVMDAVSLAREQTAEIYSAYSRIQREYEVNRFKKDLTHQLSTEIIAPLNAVQLNEFPQAEKDLKLFHVAMKDGRPELAQPQVGPTLKAVNELIETLLRIRRKMGDSVDYSKLIGKLRDLIASQTKWTKTDLAKAIDDYRGDLLEIKPKDLPSAIMVNAGQTTKVTLKLRLPDTLVTDPGLRFEIPANSGLKITPAELKLADDAKEAIFDITAGKATGIFFLKINPSQGRSFELKVVVK